jgi:eukaryotic-like serine/threonine-protein kinase
MGEVYKARDTRLDRTVAVKVLPSHIAAREDLKASFEREAPAVSSLNRPHICRLYDIGKQDGVEFMVMEHLEEETLQSRLTRGPLPLDHALKFAEQIADAVDRAHRSGVVHRDLKPGNAMLTRDGAKVLDFGLAKTAPKTSADGETLTMAITGEGTVLGTQQYMSPEQIEGKEADARADIFASGCVLCEMVTGKRAFDGKTTDSVVAAILGLDPPPMSTLQPVRPRALEELVQRYVAKDPEDRWESMRDVPLELRSAGDSAAAPQETRKVRRRWLWPAVVALAGAVGVIAGWLARPDSPPASYHVALTPPDGVSFRFGRAAGGSAISPDGTTLAFVGEADGKALL